jgi:LPS sulfotransferase NodH
MLKETGEYDVPLEYLNQGNLPYWERRFKVKGIDEVFPIVVRRRTSQNGCFSLKAHWSQFEAFQDRINEITKGVGINKIIWIARRDQLSQAISTLIAKQTGAWIAGAPMRGVAQYSYAEIYSIAIKHHESNCAWKAFLERQYPNCHMLVLYENLLADGERVHEKIRAFLGGSQTLRPSSRVQRQERSLNKEWRERFLSEICSGHQWIKNEPKWIPEERSRASE